MSITIGPQLCESVKYFILTNFVFEVLYFFSELLNFFTFFLFGSNVYVQRGSMCFLGCFPPKWGCCNRLVCFSGGAGATSSGSLSLRLISDSFQIQILKCAPSLEWDCLRWHLLCYQASGSEVTALFVY